MSNSGKEMGLTTFTGIAVLLLAVFVLVFGDNICLQLTGQPFCGILRSGGETTRAQIETVPEDEPGTGSQGSELIAEISFNGESIQIWANQSVSCVYEVEPGVGQMRNIVLTLYEGGAFAADGDAFQVADQMYGVVNHRDDVIVFGEDMGQYSFAAYSFGLCVAESLDTALQARRAASGYDDRPEYALSPES